MSDIGDTNPAETQEWIDSLSGVIEVEGGERAASGSSERAFPSSGRRFIS
jgi:pyruvate dehydrogenase complex dehydrogenase (E1) component